MITYKINQDISLEQAMNLIGKFPQYKWRNEEKTEKAIKNSILNVAAYEEENNKMVGMILAGTPDKAYFIYVHSLMVDPDYRNAGVGKKLMKTLLEECTKLDYMDTVCFAAPGARGFLEKLGFVKDLDNIQGMILAKK
ncbi:MAG: GNAT family N-acetyltransferase [Clostridiales bacterium]|uniref:GNAT family N-acetyltransferase n=1 Tax=Aminipila sp. TaxID=2060095 RepID=UPI001DABB78C|nr:GNAT family N-acetyltransferase [Aminipila sp.]MBE6033736.1 GNAT family N-acetyltransferase [Clostridiales bacterium]